MSRIVCHFSCGAASAVATKLVLADHPKDDVVIVNAFIVEEHEDNRRFLSDCERWFDHPIAVLRDEKYGASTLECWKKKRYIKGAYAAPCSFELKRNLLDKFSLPDDLHVLGYTCEEIDRYDAFIDAHNDKSISVPLIEKSLSKSDCLAMVERAGIELPMMYRLGYDNANCIGCPKGGAGYWNKIKRDFPERFYQIADIQEAIGPGANFLKNRRTGERMRLRDLPADHGAKTYDEPSFSCSFFCEMAEQDMLSSPPKKCRHESQQPIGRRLIDGVQRVVFQCRDCSAELIYEEPYQTADSPVSEHS